MAVVRGLFGATVVGGLLWAAPALAQTGTVNGRVVDSTTQQPLGGASIRLEGTQRGAQTREDGSFTLTAVPTGRQSLRISRIGYAAQISPVTVNEGANTVPPVRLRQLAATLAPVVAVGYGTQRREATTAAVTTVNTSEARVGVQPNVNNLVQGRAAGVSVTQNSGDPGASAQIRIRGSNSITGNNDPLYVVDGIPLLNNQTITPGPGTDPSNAGTAPLNRSPLNTINPEDIADISILKDAAATAIYGSRAANGVILITTKRGVAGTSSTEYDGYYSAGVQARKYDLLSGDAYRSFVNSEVQAGRLAAAQLSGLGTANTDWQSAVNRTANIQNHNVAISGGSQATQYRASVNYFDNPGVVQGTYLNRIAGRLNGSTRLLGDKLNLNINLNPSQERDRYLVAENTGGFLGGTLLNTLVYNPTYPVRSNALTTGYFEQGPGAQNNRNPVALANNLQDRATVTRVLGNASGAYTIINGLTLNANVGVDRSSGNRGTFYPNSNPLGAGFGGLVQQGQLTATTQTFNSFLSFDRSFENGLVGAQSFNVTAGYEYQRANIAQQTTLVTNLLSDAVSYNSLGVGTAAPPVSSDSARVTVSYFARATYGIKDRYFINGVVRRDGASVFGANNKYATFPGGSLSWVMSNEPWFRNNGLFSNLKFRGSFGSSGVQAINPYQSLTLLNFSPGGGYPFGGGAIVTGASPFQVANPNLKWQTTIQADGGIDFGVLNNRITGTLDYYSKITRDLLYAVNIPQPAVVTTQLQNIGKVKNAGFEGSIDGQVINQPGKSLSLGFVFSADRNRVVSLGNSVTQIFTGTASGRGQSNVNTQVIQVGQPLGTFYGPVFAGTTPVTVQLSNGGTRVDTVAVYNKYDASGHVTGTVQQSGLNQATDYRILGSALPRFTTGFRGQGNLGRAYVNFLVRAQTGFKVFNNTALVYATKAAASQNQNFIASALNDGLSISQSPFYSSRFVESGNFIRLQNVTVGYDLNLRNITRRVNSARIYVSGDNLLLGTSYSGLDPEVYTGAGVGSAGIDYLTFPRARTFTIGTRLGF